MKPLTLVAAFALVTLSGCSTYFAKQEFQKEMLRLCELDGGTKIYRTVELDPKYFKNGVVQFDLRSYKDSKRPPLTIGDGRYELTLKKTSLKIMPEHLLSLDRVDTKVIDRATGGLIAEELRYCRAGGDSLSLNNTVECCPGFKGGVESAFVPERK